MSKINVYLRIRPVFHKPDEEPEDSCIRSADNSTIEMINLRNTQETVSYKFQQVFGENSSQEEVFGTALQPLLSHFTDDVQNVSVLAYGPTGSDNCGNILIPGITEIKVENFNDFEKYFVPASHQRSQPT
ncbi:unnamed protein product [Clavelina lepadiformis]|uniref:Kinesin motor domain-containing protein n=1 Tax=Clavelina lepadiformis TaxID=159417 RepID=A0ABP0F1V9_CLALP